MESNYKPSHPHLNHPRYYNAQVKRWFYGITCRAEILNKHNFGDVWSLLKVEINRWLIKDLVARWDTIDRVLRFGTIDPCATIEEYSQILRVHYDTDSIFMPPLNQGFKVRMSNDLGIKKKLLGLRIEENKCPIDFLFQFVRQLRCLPKNQLFFKSSREEWNHVLAFELVILKHLLFNKNSEGVDVRLLHF